MKCHFGLETPERASNCQVKFILVLEMYRQGRGISKLGSLILEHQHLTLSSPLVTIPFTSSALRLLAFGELGVFLRRIRRVNLSGYGEGGVVYFLAYVYYLECRL